MTQALKVENLKKTYAGGVEALKGISFDVEQGDFFALLGPNGAGKSTAINIISSLVNKSEGKIEIFGHDIIDDPRTAKSFLGLVPQEMNFNVFETVLDVVVNQAGFYGVPRKVALERAEFHLKQLELWDKRDTQTRKLSGGMRRRVMIVRALLHEPKLLILDEPTAGVDVELRQSMWGYIREINAKGTTIILTTHYLEEAEQLCKNIAIINHGEIVHNSSMKGLLGQLDRESFVMTLDKPLEKLPELPCYGAQLVDPVTLEVEVKKDQNLNCLFGALSENTINVLTLRNKQNRLEKLFMDLVGE